MNRWKCAGKQTAERISLRNGEENGKKNNKKGKKLASNYHKTSFWDYENEKMNDYDNWSDPFGDERAFYYGWSREDVESGLSDAYE